MNSRKLLVVVLFSTISFSCSRQLSQLHNFFQGPKLDIQTLDFEYIKGKAKINYLDKNRNIKATANIRIKKDSVIWISMSSAGFEGARAVINKDSVIFIDRLHKEYYYYSFPELSEQFHFELNYPLIQAMLMGDLLVPLDKNETITKTDSYYHVKQQKGSISIENFISRSLMKIERVEMLDAPTQNTLSLNYGDFQSIDNQAFPFSQIIYLNYNGTNEKVSTKIDIQINKAEIVKKLKFPFNLPQKYERR